MATTVTKEFVNFDAKLSIDNPLPDYLKLMEDKMRADVIMPHDVYNECWNKISGAARETLWKILFDDKKPAEKEQLEEAVELLKMLKEDSCFYQAAEYNKWIVKVRDELLKRNMLEFWKNEIVAKELGPCWARDSDLFDDSEDPEPANFYNYANCEAPWLKKKTAKNTQNENIETLAASSLPSDTPKTTNKLRKISLKTALEDYQYNVEMQAEIDGDDHAAFTAIFSEAQEIVWHLLFDQQALTPENSKLAAALLEAYKSDAVFYNPWDYNDWIPKVKDELLKRKYFDFWENVMVKKELGLCWARDSDFFFDLEDPVPVEFYKSGNEIMKKHQK